MLKILLGCALAICGYVFAGDVSRPIVLFDSKKLAQAIIPAVVDVYAYRDGDEIFQPFELGDIEAMLFGAKRYQHSSGTGCVITSDGIIVTCNHVVERANRISIGFNDGRKLKATKIFANAKDDIAFLKVEAKDLSLLILANAKTQIDLGEQVLVVGNAFGLGKTSIFQGLVSFINRVVDGKVVLQSDANIGVGNSGGPMVNSMGEMIGMAFAIPRAGGLSFFIPAGLIQYYYNREILKKPSPWWGVQVQVMSVDMLEGIGLKDMNIFGVIVTELAQTSSEDALVQTSLQRGDVIIAINGQKLNSVEELAYFEKISTIGVEVAITVWRDAKLQKVKLIPVKEPEVVAKSVNGPLLQKEIQGGLQGKGQGKQGVLQGVQFEETANGVTVKHADHNDLFVKGDRVLILNKITIKSLQDIAAALSSGEQGISVVIERQGVKISQAFAAGENGSFFSQSIMAG